MEKYKIEPQLKFKKLIETRFADPITALDLSTTYVSYGSAFGKIVFYVINEDESKVICEAQRELIRGVSNH